MSKRFNYATVKVKNKDGEFEDLPALRGSSSYELAVQNGFEGTEAEWMELMIGDGWVGSFQDLDKRINKLKISAETMRLFGFSIDNGLDDIISLLGSHWWEVNNNDYTIKYNYELVQCSGSENLYTLCGRVYTITIDYADSIIVTDDGVIELINPESVTYTRQSSGIIAPAGGKFANKFMKIGSTIYFANSSAIIRALSYSDNTFVIQTENRGNYVYIATLVFEDILPGTVTYVYSPDRNAYPDNDGVYSYLGKLFDNAISVPKIKVGSYVGTGTYGMSNPSILTFGFAPKFVQLMGFYRTAEDIRYQENLQTLSTTEYTQNRGFNAYSGYGSQAYAKKSNDGTLLSWYSKNSAAAQCNTSGVTYYYIAIG